MIQEELYIIDKSGRHRLDIKSPSGITLKYENVMLKDLTKISGNKSYTFSLPRTENNARLLRYADDIRAGSPYWRTRVRADYVLDGVSIFKEAWIYLKEYADKTYKCNLVDRTLKGLEEMKDDDYSLPELRKAITKRDKWDVVGAELQELNKDTMARWCAWCLQHAEVANIDNVDYSVYHRNIYDSNPARGGLPAAGPKYGEQQAVESGGTYTGFDNGKLLQYPLYQAGIPWVRNAHASENYSGVQRGVPGKLRAARFGQGSPKPVVPVYYLLKLIEKIYDIGIDLGESFASWSVDEQLPGKDPAITYGVLPLCGYDMTDKQAEEEGMSFRIGSNSTVPMADFGFEEIIKAEDGTQVERYFTIAKNDKQLVANSVSEPEWIELAYRKSLIGMNYKNPMFMGYSADGFGDWPPVRILETENQGHKIYDPVGFYTGRSFKINGKISIVATDARKQVEDTDTDFSKPGDYAQLLLIAARIVGARTESRAGIKYKIIRAMEPTSSDGWFGGGDTPVEGLTTSLRANVVTWNFDEDEGFEPIKCDCEGTYGEPMYYFFGMSPLANAGGFDVKSNDIRVVPTAEGDLIQEMDSITNLPGISIKDFVKYAFFIAGKYPQQEGDTIRGSEFQSIIDDVKHGRALDWSDKLCGADDSGPDVQGYEATDMKRYNYFLVKGDEKDMEDHEWMKQDDVYERGLKCVEIEGNVMEGENDVITFPYYPPYIKNGRAPHMYTGNTIKAWNYEVDGDKLDYKEAKPAYGVVEIGKLKVTDQPGGSTSRPGLGGRR